MLLKGACSSRLICQKLHFLKQAAAQENQQFANAKTKRQISCAVTAQLFSTFAFATEIVQFLLYLYQKFQAISLLP